MRRLTGVGTALVVVALALAAALPASSQQQRGDLSFRVMEVTTEGKFVNVGRPRPSLGDALVFHSDLRREGETIGHDGGTCTVVSVEEPRLPEFQCVATLWFDEGQITAQGLVQFNDEPFEVAITGGTGAYEGAAGHITVVPRTERRSRLTISLVA
jgi:hypothetical protein